MLLQHGLDQCREQSLGEGFVNLSGTSDDDVAALIASQLISATIAVDVVVARPRRQDTFTLMRSADSDGSG